MRHPFDPEGGSIAWALMAYFAGTFFIFFTYTFLWDFFRGFWNIALSTGADADNLGYLYTMHTIIPAIAWISMTIGLFAYIHYSRVPG